MDYLSVDDLDSLPTLNKSLVAMCLMGYRIDSDGVVFKPNGEVMKTYERKGYPCVSFRLPSKFFGRRNSNYIGIHRYQCFAKYGVDMFSSGVVARHSNNNKQDSSFDNILIGTHKENHLDNPEFENNQKLISATAASQDKTILKNYKIWENVLKDRELGLTYDQLKDKYGFSKSTLSYHLGNGKKKASDKYIKSYTGDTD